MQVTGVTRLVAERRRLVDVLNRADSLFELESAKVTLGGGEPRQLPSIALDKRSILAAVPRETEEQMHRRAILTSMVGRAETFRAPIVLFLPPLSVQGVAHIAPGSAKFRASLEIFPHRFFAVTDARLQTADGFAIEAPAVIVNRDALVAFSLLPPEEKSGRLSL